MGQLEDISTFIRVVEAGGIGKAADQLGIAKSAVSRRLAELEGRLGAKLLNRTTRALTLTEIGQSYYTRAIKVVDDVNELNVLTTDNQHQLKGRIRLAVPVSFGVAHMSAAIDDFLTQHPALSFDIDFSDRQIDLIQEGIDIALRIGELPDSSLQARKLTQIHLRLCASPKYLEKFGTPTTPKDLKAHKLLKYAGSRSSSWKIYDAKNTLHTIKLTSQLVGNNGDFLKQLALKGHGIIATPSFISWEALKSGELVEVLPSYTVKPLYAYAIYPRTRYLSQRARIFIDFLASRFGGTPYWDE